MSETSTVKLSRPISNEYNFYPKPLPLAGESVRSIHWNSVKKELVIYWEETGSMDVHRYLEFLRRWELDSKKSPFVDVDGNMATLIIRDEAKNPVAEVRFREISLRNCETDFSRVEYLGISEPQPLMYEVTLSYQFEEVVDVRDLLAPKAGLSFTTEGNKVMDEEWQTTSNP